MIDFNAANWQNMAVIAYHCYWPGAGDDPFYWDNPDENYARIWYAFTSTAYTPYLFFDEALVPGSTTSLYQPYLNSRLTVDSPLTIDLDPVPTGGNNWSVDATVTNVSGSTVSGNVRFVLTESGLGYVGPNGTPVHDWVSRDLVPDQVGTPISLTPSSSTVVPRNFLLDPTWYPGTTGMHPENCQLIVFVQNDGTKEIYQGARRFYPFNTASLLVQGTTASEQLDDGDGLLDPGEIGNVVVTLSNRNPVAGTGLTGTLSSSDPYVTIMDGSASFSDAASLGTGDNAADPFVVQVSPSCPYGYYASLDLHMAGDGGLSTDLTVKVGIGSPTDHIGPDAGGYYAYEDTDPGYDETPVYSWVEINGVGTQIVEADEGRRTLTLPFTFPYYGVDYTQITVCSNGWAAMGFPVPGTFPDPRHIPDSDGPQAMIAGAWCDLDPSAAGSGNVYWYSDTANHRFIVEFDGVEHYSPLGDGDPETFQYILLDPAYYPTSTGEGEILVQYKSVTHPELMTVGIEDDSQTIGIEYSYLGTNNPASAGVVNHRVIKYTPDAPVATSVPGVSPVAGGPVTLMAASPNPFAQSTALRFRLPVAQDAALRVYSVEGRLVRTLVSGTQDAGWHDVRWDGMDDSGKGLSSGLYFARLQTGDEVQVQKMLLTH